MNFGDGSPISNKINPTHKYTKSRSFDVSLKVWKDGYESYALTVVKEDCIEVNPLIRSFHYSSDTTDTPLYINGVDELISGKNVSEVINKQDIIINPDTVITEEHEIILKAVD